MKRYGYHRTSTREQHLDRGIKVITAYCEQNNLGLEKIFTDQQTGKNFNRPRYQVLKEDVLRAGDELIITDLPQLLYNIKHSSWSYEKEYRCIIASTANGMPFIDAKPKAIYIGRDCSDKNADCLFDIADEHEAKIYKMGFDDCVDSYELYYYEFYK